MASKYQKHVAEHAKRYPKDSISASAGADQKLADLKEMLAAAEEALKMAHIQQDEKKHAKAQKICANLRQAIDKQEQRKSH